MIVHNNRLCENQIRMTPKNLISFFSLLIYLFSCVNLHAQQTNEHGDEFRKYKVEAGFGFLGISGADSDVYLSMLLSSAYRFQKNEVGIRLIRAAELNICLSANCSDATDIITDISLLYSRNWTWKILEGGFYSGVSFIHMKRYDIFNSTTRTYSARTTNYAGVPLGLTLFIKTSDKFGLGIGSGYEFGKSKVRYGHFLFRWLLK